ncbi:RNA polymerase sigma factor [Xanthomonas oryzae]|nr:RNA polymerase sigma factor [Xanthomonas oryzae]QBH03001.1 RNA polymerase sigma factor [Xanthomonas oryzae]
MSADTLDLMLQRDLPSAAAGCQQVDGRSALAYQNTVPPMSLAITRDIAASEDIAQEAFLRAWQRLAQLHQPASCLPWLRQTTHNLARDWLRANRHRARSGEAPELAIAMAADPAPSRADQLLQVEEKSPHSTSCLHCRKEAGARASVLPLCAAMAVLNSQCLRILPRVMRPMLERDARRRGATRAPLLYRCMFSPGAMMVSTAAVILPIAQHDMRLGML